MNIVKERKVMNRLSVKGLVLTMLLCVLGTNLFSYSFWNMIGFSFSNTADGSLPKSPLSAESTKPIETYVVESAGYFLNGFSGMMTFSNRYELMDINGLNFEELNLILENVLSNTEKAKQAYSELIQRAQSTPYNKIAIDRLMNFDYAGFAEKNNVNQPIYNEVVQYLKKGDINGVIKYAYSNVSLISEKVKLLKEDISANKVPTPAKLMDASETFAKSLMAGQYGAAIFESIAY